MNPRGRPVPIGWAIAGVLFGLYLFLKLQTGWFAYQTGRQQRQMERMRPALNAFLAGRQMEANRQKYDQFYDQIRRMDLNGLGLLLRLSMAVPLSVTIERMEVQRDWFRLEGSCWPGVRDPEEPVVRMSAALQGRWPRVWVEELRPDSPEGMWHFELRGEAA